MRIREQRRRGYVVAFGLYTALLAIALLAPTSGTQSHMASWVVDVASWVGVDGDLTTQARAEFLCNALILAPVSALGSLIWTSTTWKDWTAYTFVVATSVELAQGLLLPDRTASTVDIAANTLGGLLGAVFVLVVRRVVARVE